MNYHDITKCDMLNGPGLRVVLWVAGCNHYCPGCQNPVTWDENDGLKFDKEAEAEMYIALCKEYISGLTFSGGDPLFLGNRDEITSIAKDAKSMFPNKTIWCYTGYAWEEVKDLELMRYIDVLVDGEYKEELRDPKLHWVGSSNQRIIDVQKSLRIGDVVLLTEQE